MTAVNEYAYWIWYKVSGKAQENWTGVDDLSSFLSSLAEAVILGLVVFLMLPIGEDQRFKRQEFQRFLFVGFVDRRELEEAIRLQYPNLTE